MLANKLEWEEKTVSRPGWDSTNGDYRIVVANNGKHRLISFIHEGKQSEFAFWDFDTLDEAKQYAEKI